jgi:hypothetical protein
MQTLQDKAMGKTAPAKASTARGKSSGKVAAAVQRYQQQQQQQLQRLQQQQQKQQERQQELQQFPPEIQWLLQHPDAPVSACCRLLHPCDTH